MDGAQWSVARSSRWFAGILWVLLVVLISPTELSWTTLGTTALVLCFFGSIFWILTVRPRVRLTTEAMEVRNFMGSATIPRSEVVEAKAGYLGLEIRTRDGSRFTANAIQKSNIAVMLGSPSRADRVIEDIHRWRDS